MDSDLQALKSAARKAAFARRKAAKSIARDAQGAQHLMDYLRAFCGHPIAGYMPIRSEIDPLPVMREMAASGPVSVPVIDTQDAPLRFRQWTPQSVMVDGPFGARIPQKGAWIIPELVIVPLVAFDRSGGRLGYGGGFYDRTLEGLRAKGTVHAVGYAYGAQEASDLPLEPTDQALDAIVTETGVISGG